MYKIYKTDCLKYMQEMMDRGERVDAIVTDPPYLYLNHRLDRRFDEELFFALASKITDKIIFFGRGDSFYKWNLLAKEHGLLFKEEIIWNKGHISSPFNKIGRCHETISVRCRDGFFINKIYLEPLRKAFDAQDFSHLLHDLNKLLSSIKNNDVLKNYLDKGERLLSTKKIKHGITAAKSKDINRIINLYNKYEKGSLLTSIVSIVRDHYQMEHPTQKPVRLMRILIKLISNKGDTIFDPFMGGGSTGVGALLEERKFIGCDIDEEYFNIASKRIGEKYKTLKENLFYLDNLN